MGALVVFCAHSSEQPVPTGPRDEEEGEMADTLEGERAPDFDLEGSDGRRHRLSDYAGRTVVLYFYPKDNTSGCTKEACSFRDLHAGFEGLNAILLGVSRDSLASHDRFVEKFGLPFVLLSDPDAAVMRRYGAFGEKTMYGKVTQGTIRSTVVIGPDGEVRKHWSRVKKADAHPQEVLEFLRGA
jgi:peroxiredoxin Q/BCP